MLNLYRHILFLLKQFVYKWCVLVCLYDLVTVIMLLSVRVYGIIVCGSPNELY